MSINEAVRVTTFATPNQYTPSIMRLSPWPFFFSSGSLGPFSTAIQYTFTKMEGLGAASGVIAVAQVTIQLGQTVQTLVGFWKAVRDAPEDVEMLFEEFSMLSSLIAQTREKGPYEESDPIIDTASCRCNALLSKLKAKLPPSTSDFKTASSRVRTWKRLKHALKKNEIKELMGSIERIKTTLTFAHIRNIGQTQ